MLPLNEYAPNRPTVPVCLPCQRARGPEGAKTLAGVLDDRHPVTLADLQQRGGVSGIAEDVHGDDGADAPAGRAVARAFVRAVALALQELGDLGGVHVQMLVAVHEHRLGADVAHGVDGSDERQRRDEDLVLGTDARQQQGDVQRRGTAAHRDGVGCPGRFADGVLEAARCRRPAASHPEETASVTYATSLPATTGSESGIRRSASDIVDVRLVAAAGSPARANQATTARQALVERRPAGSSP